MTTQTPTPATCIVRDTAAKKGRTRSVAPGVTAARYLHYGRIILDPGDGPLAFATGEMETGFICLNGTATIRVDGAAFSMVKYDSLYAPRDASIEVTPGEGGCDIAEIAAPVAGRHPVQFVSFADVRQNPGLHFETGGAVRQARSQRAHRQERRGGADHGGGHLQRSPATGRRGRRTSTRPCSKRPTSTWTCRRRTSACSWSTPNAREPEVATIVREGDVVLMPSGYHPNVAVPGGRINFIWMMAANREDVDRQYGVVNVQPEFASMGSGLDKGRTEAK